MPATPPALVKAHEDYIALRDGVSAATARRAPTEPALHPRPAGRRSDGTARRRQGSMMTPPPRRTSQAPPPRGRTSQGSQPPEVIPPAPPGTKAACLIKIAHNINAGVAHLCLTHQNFAEVPWHPQHKNKSRIYTPR